MLLQSQEAKYHSAERLGEACKALVLVVVNPESCRFQGFSLSLSLCIYIYIYNHIYIYILLDRLFSTGQLSTSDRPVIYLVTATSKLASQACQLV